MATKARSPNYPQISLRKAVDLARKIYDEAHTHKAPAKSVASILGYASLNGASLGVLSALKKYGLLESVGEDVRISQEGLTILVDPPESVERAQAIMRAAFRPVLFADLRKEYGDSLPKSDEFLRAFLLKRGFVQSVVDVPIRTYRDTMILVAQAKEVLVQKGAGEARASQPDAGDDEDEMIDASVSDIKDPPAARRVSMPASAMASSQSADTVDDVYKLADGRAFMLRWPARISADEYADFEAWIALLQRKLKRQIEQ
ncbi:MAG TPA: hypothetical protein PLA97_00900 [Rubrivivax sp.]|nr:hypothetical protein [Rubrivivax sp.]